MVGATKRIAYVFLGIILGALIGVGIGYYSFRKSSVVDIMPISLLSSGPEFYHGKTFVVVGTVTSEFITDVGYESSTSRMTLGDMKGNQIFVEVFDRQTNSVFPKSYAGHKVLVMGVFIYPYADPQGIYDHSLTASQVSIIIID